MAENLPKMKFVFAGHQTFPFRQLWPYKAYHACISVQEKGTKPFDEKIAMVSLGVGANMVLSMRFWARAIGIIDQHDLPTKLGQRIFGTPEHNFTDALDRYCESETSLWLFHWNLAKTPDRLTTLWFLFNKLGALSFTKQELKDALISYLTEQLNNDVIKRLPSDKSIERDIDVVLRAYSPKTHDVGVLRKVVASLDNAEEVSDDPLCELKLISVDRDTYTFDRTEHPTLNHALFAYCLLDYQTTHKSNLIALDFNRIAYDDGSLGKVFKLDENTLGEHLQALSATTGQALQWSEQNGVRQVICTVNDEQELSTLKDNLLIKAYSND